MKVKILKAPKVKADPGIVISNKLQPKGFTPSNVFTSVFGQQPVQQLPGMQLEPLTAGIQQNLLNQNYDNSIIVPDWNNKKNWNFEEPIQEVRNPDDTVIPQGLSLNTPLINSSTGGVRPLSKIEDYDTSGYTTGITKPKQSTANTQSWINLGIAGIGMGLDYPQPQNNSLKANEQVMPNYFSRGAPLNPNQGIGQVGYTKNGGTIPSYAYGGVISDDFAIEPQLAENGLQIENDAYEFLSPGMIKLKGNSHENGGTDLAYFGSKVEAEAGETVIVQPGATSYGTFAEDGANVGENSAAIVFGNLYPNKNPIADAMLKTVELPTNKKFKNIAENIGKQQNKDNKGFQENLKVIEENTNPQDIYTSIKQKTAELNMKNYKTKLDTWDEKLKVLTQAQELQNTMNDNTAKNGKVIKAGSGITADEEYLTPIDEIKKQYPWLNPFIKSNTKQGRTSPTGADTLYADSDLTSLYKNIPYWEEKAGRKFTSTKDLQQTVYSMHQLTNPNIIKDMWKEFGHTAKSNSEDMNNFADGKAGKRSFFAINKKLELPKKDMSFTSEPPLIGGNTDKSNTKAPPNTVVPPNFKFDFTNSWKKQPYAKSPYNMLNDAGEIMSLGYEPTAVNYSTVQPNLNQPYNVSFQDRRNQILSQLRSSHQYFGDNPFVQSVLSGQGIEQLQPINGEETRINQSIYDTTLTNNNQLLNQSKAFNSGQFDKMSENRAANDFNKFAVRQKAFQNMGYKRGLHTAADSTAKVFLDSLNNYTRDSSGDLTYTGQTSDNLLTQGLAQLLNQKQTETVKDGNKTTKSETQQKVVTKNGKTISHSRMMKLM